MTKKRAYKLLKHKYGHYHSKLYVGSLCFNIPEELAEDWKTYWNKINTNKRVGAIPQYDRSMDFVEISLVRLLTLYFFIEDTYK